MNFSLDFVTPSECTTQADFELIETAFTFAQTAHRGQERKSGEPYFSHLYAVGKVTWEKYRDAELTAAALLHDTVEDCKTVERADIYNTFGNTVGFLVDAVTKNYFDFYNREEKFDEKAERILWAGEQDIRTLLLKLADREHNLSTVKFLPPNKQVRMSFETQAIYEPLKKILSYNDPVSLRETAERHATFTAAYKLHTPLQLREHLFKETFENIDRDSYPVVYAHPESIVWRVDGMKMYLSLVYNKIFENRIEFVLIRATAGSDDDVQAFFKFKTGAVAKDGTVKMNLSSYKTH